MRLPVTTGVFAVLLMAVTPATSQSFSGYYKLKSMYLEQENRCLEGNRPEGSPAMGGAAFMDRCQDVTGQLWKLTREANGYYRLTTKFVEPDGRCFESNRPTGNPAMGGAAFMDRCQNVSGQLWKLTPEANGYYRMTSMFVEPEGRCLESNKPAGNASMGGRAFMDRCQNVSGQLWKLVPAGGQQTTSASPPVSPPVPTASAPPARADHQSNRVQRTPTVIAVGKWAEGFAVDGKWLWVAESGDRTLAKVDFNSGRVVERFKVGRLPTEMVSTGDGNVFAMVATDKKIWSQNGRGRRDNLTQLSECPEAMIADDNDLWALTLPECSSDKSRVIRIDTRSGRQTRSPVLGQWAQALAAHRGSIWVAHAREPALTIVDKASMRPTAIDTGGSSLWSIAGNSAHVFGGGRVDGTTDDGLILKFNPANFSVLARATVPQRVAKIICDEDFVVAVGDKGMIWVFSAGDLKLLRTIELSAGAFEPRAAALHEDSLLVSSGKYRGENGAVFVIGNWRPDAQQVAAPVADPVAPARGQRIFPSFDCASASSTAERFICANNQLASLDKAMAAEYDMAFGNITSEAVGGTVADALAFKREQRTWLRKRDNCGGDEDCLFATYQSRLRVIEKMNQPE